MGSAVGVGTPGVLGAMLPVGWGTPAGVDGPMEDGDPPSKGAGDAPAFGVAAGVPAPMAGPPGDSTPGCPVPDCSGLNKPGAGRNKVAVKLLPGSNGRAWARGDRVYLRVRLRVMLSGQRMVFRAVVRSSATIKVADLT